MKTPTLIVRLAGLYLLGQCTLALLQAHKMQAMVGEAQNAIFGDIQLYATIGLLIGLVATIFAGPLARILTFDSGPRGRSDDF